MSLWNEVQKQYLREMCIDADQGYERFRSTRPSFGRLAWSMNMHYFPEPCRVDGYNAWNDHVDRGMYNFRNVYNEIARNPRYYGRREPIPFMHRNWDWNDAQWVYLPG